MSPMVLTTITLYKDMLQSEHKGFLILCEYMRRRRQRGVKRVKWDSGLDLCQVTARKGMPQGMCARLFWYQRSRSPHQVRDHLSHG